MAGTLILGCEFGCGRGLSLKEVFLKGEEILRVSKNSGINSTPHGKIIRRKDQKTFPKNCKFILSKRHEIQKIT